MASEGASGVGSLGRILGPVLALAVYFLLRAGAVGEDGLTPQGAAVAAIGVLMAVSWVTEALPLPATSLLPVALFPLVGVMPIRDATVVPYAHEFIFLFMGGFMVAQAIEKWGLHRRVALLTLLAVGTRPRHLVGGFMLASAFLSMWISNTATAVMMLPIATSVAGRMTTGDAPRQRETLTVCLLLGVAYGATIGGIATLIGTPPNVFLAGFLKDSYGMELGFGQWMLLGVPLAAVLLPLTWLLLTRVIFPLGDTEVAGGRAMIRRELQELGSMTTGERRVLAVFVCTALAWILRQPVTQLAWAREHLPSLAGLHDAGIAILAALVLFALPAGGGNRERVLDWGWAKRLPWGVLLLFGGGLSLARGIRATGLDTWLSRPAEALAGRPEILLVLVVVAVIVFLTELTSNTATAATFLPVLGAVAVGAGVDPLHLVIPGAIAASCAFMLPVATPPNAVVFASESVRIGHMVRAGIMLNGVAIALIVLLAFTVLPWVFGTGS